MTDADDALDLLRALVREDTAAVEAALAAPGTDLAKFLRFAHQHQLGAYAYWMLRRLGAARALPPPVLAATKASSLADRLRTERLAERLRQLAELFAAGGVPVLFIKGPLFAQRFYGSLDARGFADLDLLLRSPGELDRVEALLLEAGYERAFRTLMGRTASRYFAHHFEYRRDALGLDVHWALQRHFTFAIDYERMWATSAPVVFGDRAYRAASDEYELVLQLLGLLTDLQVGKLVLRSLVDVYRVLRTVDGTLDWPAFFAARRRERIERPCAYLLAVVLDVLACRAQFPALDALLDARASALPPTRLARHAVLASRKADVRQKLLSFRLYETAPAAAFAWWLVSLPFRFAVYDAAPRPPAAARRTVVARPDLR